MCIYIYVYIIHISYKCKNVYHIVYIIYTYIIFNT